MAIQDDKNIMTLLAPPDSLERLEIALRNNLFILRSLAEAIRQLYQVGNEQLEINRWMNIIGEIQAFILDQAAESSDIRLLQLIVMYVEMKNLTLCLDDGSDSDLQAERVTQALLRQIWNERVDQTNPDWLTILEFYVLPSNVMTC